jgi:hypothetical protein
MGLIAKSPCFPFMKKIFLFLILLSSSSVLAQSAKVLVCAPGDLNAAKATDSVLAKFYFDPIDVSDTITDAINNYEAVFLISKEGKSSSSDELLLKKYLQSNKKIYLENYFAKLDPNDFSPGSRKVDSTCLLYFIGLTSVGYDLVNFGVHFVQGSIGAFTEGMNFENKNYSPLDDNFSSLYLYGNINRVLSPLPDPSIDIAVISKSDSFKAVLHYPIIQDYYEEFLHRVICNYFGLCTQASVKQTETTAAKISLFPNPARDVLHIRSNTDNPGLQSVEIISETGTLISKFSLDPNENRFDFDLGNLNITNGNYILNFETLKESFLKKVTLLK